jgi:uncharacterized membrane protein
MSYLILKYIHIISSTILFGTGIGSAFYMFMANLRKDIAVIYFATRHVVIADFIFTMPSVIIQLISGTMLIKAAGYEYSDAWIMWAYILYFFAALCWLPVVWMQIKMRNMAKNALDNNKNLPDDYWKMYTIWIILGYLAFPAIMIIFYLMVFKPE